MNLQNVHFPLLLTTKWIWEMHNVDFINPDHVLSFRSLRKTCSFYQRNFQFRNNYKIISSILKHVKLSKT